MSGKVKIAMISLAHVHAWGYLEQAQGLENAEIVCIWDDMESRGREGAEKFDVPFVADFNKALKGVDAVIVNSETSKHHEHYLKVLAAGKHVFTEKTLTLTTEQSDEVVVAAKKAGVKFTVSLPSRTRSENILFKQVIEQGLIGKVTMLRARVAHSGALGRWFEGDKGWFVDEAEAGGGAMFDLGCHTTDMVRWLMGKPKSAVALMNSLSGNYDIDDNSAAVVEFENGAIAMLDTGFCHTAGPNTFEIFGTEGFIGRGYPGQGLIFESKNFAGGIGGSLTPKMPENKPSIMEAWLSAIIDGTPLITDATDGRNLTQMLEGCYTAWRTGARYDFKD